MSMIFTGPIEIRLGEHSRHCPAATKEDLEAMEKRLMAKQAELAQQLRDNAERLEKVAGETRSLLETIDALKDAVEAADNVSPELQAAADKVFAQTAVVDGLVPDPETDTPA